MVPICEFIVKLVSGTRVTGIGGVSSERVRLEINYFQHDDDTGHGHVLRMTVIDVVHELGLDVFCVVGTRPTGTFFAFPTPPPICSRMFFSL